MQEEELKKAVLVVLANKQDLEEAMTVSEIHTALGLDALKSRTFQIFKTSALKGNGLDEAMEWCAPLSFLLAVSFACCLLLERRNRWNVGSALPAIESDPNVHSKCKPKLCTKGVCLRMVPLHWS